MEDYYDILGITKKATPEEIKSAFRRLAKKYHPDAAQGSADMFKKINEAYQVLSDEKKRAAYDRFGHAFQGGGQRGTADFDFSGFDFQRGAGFEDIFKDFGSFFGDFRGDFGVNNTRDRKGEDIYVNLEIDLKESILGATREIEIKRYEPCSRCKGTGGEQNTVYKTCARCKGKGKIEEVEQIFFASFKRVSECPICQGQGQVPDKPCTHCHGKKREFNKSRIQIRIPRGVESDTLMEIKGEGNLSPGAARAGDLFVKFTVRANPLFKVESGHLITEKEIDIVTATLGGNVSVPTITDETVSLEIPEGTDSGQIFRMKNQGLYKGLHREDLFVRIKIVSFKHLSQSQKEILKKLKN